MNLMSVNGEKWIVSLSDGRTLDEDILSDEPQRISPWGKLLEILARDSVYITNLRVQVLGRNYNCVSRSDRARYVSDIQPTGYMCYRRVGIDALRPGMVQSHCIGMEAQFNGYKVITWVDVYTGESWIQVIV